MAITGRDITAEARSWLGTRFKHQGRNRRTASHSGGVDCLGLLMGVAGALHLSARDQTPLYLWDERQYSKAPDGAYMQQRLGAALWEISSHRIRCGDIGLFNWDGQPQHLAFFGDYRGEGRGMLSMIHAFAPAGRVIEHGFDAIWQARLAAPYRPHDLLHPALPAISPAPVPASPAL